MIVDCGCAGLWLPPWGEVSDPRFNISAGSRTLRPLFPLSAAWVPHPPPHSANKSLVLTCSLDNYLLWLNRAQFHCFSQFLVEIWLIILDLGLGWDSGKEKVYVWGRGVGGDRHCVGISTHQLCNLGWEKLEVWIDLPLKITLKSYVGVLEYSQRWAVCLLVCVCISKFTFAKK